MKQLKSVSKITMQSSTSKKGKTLMKHQKNIKTENTKQPSKEVKTLTKQQKMISRLKIKKSIIKEGKYKNRERKRI